jgi:hypothetical protein
VSLETPLLIPSFSSKGFARSKKDGKSEIGKILAAVGEFLTEAYLISAYDIYYEHLPSPSKLPFTPELLFLDSGGYEISTDRDYSSVIDALPAPDPWDDDKLKSVLDHWPDEIPAVLISYDQPDEKRPFPDQVAAARRLFRGRSQHLHLFLLKPETDTQTTLDRAINSAAANATELGIFDIIGVTEKELGRCMMDRMVNVAKLRFALDDADIKSPIHIFGALDPLSVCLYFIAGAELFDGLTWIRYAYDGGRCIYTHNHGALKYGLHTSDDLVKSRAISENYFYLRGLQHKLREFCTTGSFEKLEPHSKFLEDALDSLKTRLKRRS